MAVDAFLALDGIKGESNAKGAEGWIEIMSWSFGASQNTSVGGATAGAGAGKVTFAPLTIVKRADTGSAKLWLACCNGSHFAKVNFMVRKAGGTALAFLKAELATVFVKDFSIKIDALKVDAVGKVVDGGSDTPLEYITFVYNKLQLTYTPQKSDGTGGSPIVAGWDQMTNSGG